MRGHGGFVSTLPFVSQFSCVLFLRGMFRCNFAIRTNSTPPLRCHVRYIFVPYPHCFNGKLFINNEPQAITYSTNTGMTYPTNAGITDFESKMDFLFLWANPKKDFESIEPTGMTDFESKMDFSVLWANPLSNPLNPL